MIALCSWCLRDGRPALLGEREPIGDPGITHGICAEHEAAWRAQVEALHAQRAAEATA